MRKGYYYSVILLAAVALGVSLVMAPSERELALMHLEDKQFEQAFERYKKLLEEGDTSVNVIMPLTKLYLQAGEVDMAVSLMEQYVDDNPESISARKELGVYYQYSQRPDDYRNNLEKIKEQESDEEVLRNLSDVYNYNGEYEKQIGVLQKLIDSDEYRAIEKDYIDAAYLYASQQQYDKALSVLEKMLTRHNYDVDVETIELATSLMIDVGKDQQALEIAVVYVSKEVNLEDVRILAQRFENKKRPDLAFALLEPFESFVDQDPELLGLLISVQMGLDKDEEVFAELSQRFREGKVPETAADTLVKLAMEHSDYDLLAEIVEQISFEALSEKTLLGFIELSLILEDESLLDAMVKNLGDVFLQNNPLLASTIRLAKYRDQVVEEVLATQQALVLSNQQTFMLAGIYKLVGHKEHAIALLRNIPILKALSDFGAVEVVDMFLKLGHGEEGITLFEAAREADDGVDVTQIDLAWAMMHAGMGHTEVITTWLDETPKIHTQLFLDIYFVTTRYKQKELSLILSERLYEREPSVIHSVYLSEALIMNARYEEAIAYLEPIVETTRQAELPYLTALGRVIKQKVKEDTSKYAAEMDVLLARMLTRPDLLPEDKRNIGYILAAAGMKQKAQQIFFELAFESPPDSTDVKQVVYLWGKNPSEEGVTWLERMARASKGKILGEWLGHLNDVNNPAIVVDVVEGRKEKRVREVTDSYMGALVLEKRKKQLARILAEEIENETEPKRLKKLATMAMQQGLLDEAEKAFRELLVMLPRDLEIVKQLGTVTFYKAKYTDAGHFLHRYLSKEEGDLYTNYYYGETLWRERHYDQARRYYHRAQRFIDEMDKKDLASRIVSANLHYRYDNLSGAIDIFETLLKEFPENKRIRAEFAGIMLEMGRYREAERILLGL